MLLRRITYLVLLVLIFSGCSKTSFIGKRFDNFNAYYNTFYNAKKQYRSGVEALERASELEIDRNQYLDIFITPARVSNQNNFNDAIKKSADVLRENPGSKWVDDALMLIGKSYFYLQNYVGAEQKFQEIISLGGDLEDEARFWLARTLIASNSFSRASDHLEVSLNREGRSSRWESMFRMALGELYVKQEAWGEAAGELELSLQNAKDKNFAARAQFLLGQLYEKLEQHDNAGQAYKRVLRFKPDYSLAYAAKISQVRVEGQYGDATQALRLLRSMERDDKNFDNRAELLMQRGRIYQAMGDADRAYNTYDALLFPDDQTMNTSRVRGPVHYALGELYRDDYFDFSFAAAHFDTARTSLSQLNRTSGANGRQVQYAPEALIDSERQAEVFGSFATVYDEIAHFDSLLWLGTMDQEGFDAFILELRRERAEEMAAQQREIAKRQAEQQFQNLNNNVRQGPQKQIDGATGNQGSSEQGFLFHKDRIRVQEGRVSFITRWGERPRVPNWRRLDAIRNATSNAEDGGVADAVENAELLITEASNELLPEIDYSDVPREPDQQTAMREQRALVQYELGNVLFLAMERPDSAATWYRMVIDEAGDQPVAQRAFYALAEVQRALGDTDSANRLYTEVLERYPESDFADQVRERLGLPPVQYQSTDSLALAEAAYKSAYQLWQSHQYEQAVTDMVMLASNHAMPDMVPKALLATGSIYLEWAARDRLDVHALPLPAVPDSLLLEQGLVDSTIYSQPVRVPTNIEELDEESPALSNAAVQNALASLNEADSLRAISDNLYNLSDSLYVVSDSYYGQSSELQAVSDSLYQVSEKLQLRSDSLFARADALDRVVDEQLLASGISLDRNGLRNLAGSNTSQDTTGGGDTMLMPGRKSLKLDRLFSTIKERFPQSPHAQYADQMLRAIIELRPGQDTTIVQALAQEDLQKELDAMTPEEKHLLMPGEMDTSGKGWTLIVASFSEEERANVVMEEYKAKGYKSAVIQGATRFRVAVGQFPTLEEARSGLEAYKEELPPTTWFLDIEKPR